MGDVSATLTLTSKATNQSKFMKVLGIIPARMESVRLPGKMLEDLCGKPLIVRTYEAACKIKCLDEVIVVTDSPRIAQAVKDHKGLVWMSREVHESGSDRIAEYLRYHDCDIAVNIQGDEPFVHEQSVNELVRAFKDSSVKVATLKKRIDTEQELFNTDVVKVVCDKKDNALYFSRALIPHFRVSLPKFKFHKHIGIYAYRKETLLKFSRWALGELESTEKLEQLRFLENGVDIRVVETEHDTLTVDTAYDLEQAIIYYESRNNSGGTNSRNKRVQRL